MTTEKPLLSADDELAIVDAIQKAEECTSGEIRVHLEKTCSKDPFERAKEIFHQLAMDSTARRNGVLLYVALYDKRFVICGDKGIDEKVEEDFWDCTRDIMQEHFKNGAFKDGLIAGILRAGNKLQTYFPRSIDDQNELTNEISNG